MNQDQDRIKSTIKYYNRAAQRLIPAYDSAKMSIFYNILLNNLTHGSKILDIGFGSGRDLAFLRDEEFEIWGADPSQQFVDHAKKRFEDISDHFFNTSLPNLNLPKELEYSFDSIILIAVWMHLPKSTYESSIKSLCSFLKPGGKIILSYSITARAEISDRYFENIDTTLLEALFEEYECKKISKNTNKDGLEEREITWVTEVYSYDKL
ncbi:class I SAM-dependent methyltransferase [Sulfurovum sp. XGS-02]|uniref:class I SAM-dependent methyltransferase n=1 Tax=Sulfurovum sp. XGS-02 TaxID=2925411 RepID=UPI00204FDA14|nr:class I SAM-dependent methyltransferase [Sulfurovum sp. XGS-02]UPT76878.1 class I SAM-dependent methyltransferase [Sulfurovum sp. XGS-02]